MSQHNPTTSCSEKSQQQETPKAKKSPTINNLSLLTFWSPSIASKSLSHLDLSFPFSYIIPITYLLVTLDSSRRDLFQVNGGKHTRQLSLGDIFDGVLQVAIAELVDECLRVDHLVSQQT